MRLQTSLKAELFACALRMGILGVFALFVIISLLSLFHPAQTSAAVSSTINFQARLEAANGAIVPDGNYNVEFKLYNTSTVTGTPDQGACTYNGGTTDPGCLWVETRTSANQVRVVNGYLTVNLGSVTPFGALNWNQQLWLTMRIGGTGTPSWDAEMAPRMQLTAIPYAFQAGALGNGTNQVVLDSSGNLQFQQASTVKELSAASGTTLTIQGGAATSGTNVGGNLLLQGGVGASTGASGSVIVKPAGNDSTTAFQVQTAGSVALLAADTSHQTVVVRSGNDAKTLGPELYSGNFGVGWTATNWVLGGGNTTATHNAGNTSALTDVSNVAIVSGMTYQVSFVISGACSTVSSVVTATVGGTTLGVLDGTNCSGDTSTYVATATSSAGLTFTPTSDWSGTVSAISIKVLSGTINSAFTVENVSGNPNLEVRGSNGTVSLFLGVGSGQNNVSGDQTTAVGYGTLGNNTTGTQNTALGTGALNHNAAGSQNTAVGMEALFNNSTGSGNTSLGYFASHTNTTGTSNTAIGAYALQSNTTGSINVTLGDLSLANSTTGWANIAIGYQALGSNTTGGGNIGIGLQAGSHDNNGFFATLNNLQNAVAIGAYAQVQASNSIVLGSVDNATKVGIGITVPSNTFSVSPLDYQTGTVTRTNGSATLVGTGTTWTSAMSGDIIVFADGTTNYVGSVTDATHVTLNTTYTGTTDASPIYYRFHKQALDVTSGGLVGIGYTSPDTTLSVRAANQNAVVNIYGASGSPTDYGIIQVSSAGSLANPSNRALALQPNAGDVLIGTGTDLGARLSVAGTTLIKTTSSTAFQLQDGSSNSLLVGDTSGLKLGVGATDSTTRLNISLDTVDIANGSQLRIGGNLTSTTNDTEGIRVNPTITVSSNSTQAYTGIVASVYTTNGANLGNATISSIQAAPFFDASSGSLGKLVGINLQPTKNNAGSVTSIYDLYAQTLNNNVTGTIGTSYGLYVDAPGGGAGSTNITNKYAIVTALGAGNVGIGTVSPAASLDVLTAAGTVGLNVAGTTLSAAGAINGANASNILTVVGTAGQANAGGGFTAGSGSAVSVTAGAGGANTASSGLTTGGAGGAIAIQGGTGGTANSSTNGAGGVGGSVTIQAGTGGGGGTFGSGGTGGSVTIQAGNAGAAANLGTPGNVLIQAGSSLANGASGSVTVRATSLNSTAAFQVQNASSINLFNVDTASNNSGNQLTNPSVESAIAGNWTAKNGSGTSTLTQVTSPVYNAAHSLQVVTTGTATNAGVTESLSLTGSTAYVLSVYVNSLSGFVSTAGAGTFDMGYGTGGVDTSCLTAQKVPASAWTRFTCSFTTAASLTSPYVYFKQTDATGRTFYIDSAVLETDANATSKWQDGQITLNATIASPVIITPVQDSTNSFSVQNSEGMNVLTVDTTSTNLINNPGFEVNLNNWKYNGTGGGASGIFRDNTNSYSGQASLKLVLNATATDNVKFAFSPSTLLQASTTYVLSFWAKDSGTSYSTLTFGRAENGTQTNCVTTGAITTSWKQFSCSFTVGATIGATPYIYIGPGTASKAIYIDNVDLEPGSTASAFGGGQISLNAAIVTPIVLGGNITADPGCTPGAIYYNSSTSLFRGCQGGTWKNLIGGVDVQDFQATGTWTAPAGISAVMVIACGAGGSGGGGDGNATTTVVREGGSGGGGGAHVERIMTAADAGSSQTVTVPGATTGGGGGNGAAGSIGTAGSQASFGTLVIASGGGAGGGGPSSSATNAGGAGGGLGAAGANGGGTLATVGGDQAAAQPGFGWAGGSGGTTTGQSAEFGGAGGAGLGNLGGAGNSGGSAVAGGAGGGSGGGVTTGNVQSAGGAGGTTRTVTAGGGGTVGTAGAGTGGSGSAGNTTHCGAAGGGGGSSSSTTGGAGGGGGTPGGGGGGGGGGTSAGGAGGNGGRGEVWVISW